MICQERVFFSEIPNNQLFIAGHGLADVGIFFVDRRHFPQGIAGNSVKRHIVLTRGYGHADGYEQDRLPRSLTGRGCCLIQKGHRDGS